MQGREQATLRLNGRAQLYVDGEQLLAASKPRNRVRWQRLSTAILVISDVLLAIAIWWAAGLLRGIWMPWQLSEIAPASIASNIAVWVGLRALLGLYPGYGLDSVERLRRHAYSVFAALIALAIAALGFRVEHLFTPRLALVFFGLLILAPFVRYAAMKMMRSVGLWGKPVIVLTYRGAGAEFLRLLEDEWGQGYKPVALFDSSLMPAGEAFDESPYQATVADAAKFGREQRIDTVFFAMPYTRREQLASMVSKASESFRHVLVVPNLNSVTNSAVIARDLSGTFVVEIKHNLLDPWTRRFKRLIDLVGAIVGSIIVFPVMVLVALLIKLDSPGPVLFVQERPGRDGKMFRIHKFRTMYSDAEQRFQELVLDDPRLAAEFREHGKLKSDPRVTRVGRLLRKTSLDEVPQMWNVFKGEMSFVGPRPYLISQMSQLSGSEAIILRTPPGITGLWQVSGRSDLTVDQRVAMDIYYVRNWSVWLDLIVLAQTVKTVLFRKGAH